jgi:hypothetical protein
MHDRCGRFFPGAQIEAPEAMREAQTMTGQFGRRQTIKFLAERDALKADLNGFIAAYTVRGLAFGTDAYEAANAAFRAFMAPFYEAATAKADADYAAANSVEYEDGDED